jgi:predicted TIM-barrel fold metal-dependent hydrolase
MRIIAIEEHYSTDEVQTKGQSRPGGMPPELQARLLDLGVGRLAEMDASGIDLQVLSLSSPGVQQLDPHVAVSLARDANDKIAKVVANHPGRFAAFATIPTPDPTTAVDELERAIVKLGLKGAIINGHTHGRFLDHADFQPLLGRIEALAVPLYIHPTPPPQAVTAAYYEGFDPQVNAVLATSAWGWHMETGLHCIRLILGGVFDRFPRLQVIIGHMGEAVPFMLARSDSVLPPARTKLERPLVEYFQGNFHITTSAFSTTPPFLAALLVVGADRIIFSVDHPFSPNQVARQFLETLPVSLEDRHKIAHGNAERLLGL